MIEVSKLRTIIPGIINMDQPVIDNLPSKWQILKIMLNDKKLCQDFEDFSAARTSGTYVIFIAVYLLLKACHSD